VTAASRRIEPERPPQFAISLAKREGAARDA
jgi:hypothetical protein